MQRQYNDYIDQLAHDGVEKYSEEQQQQIDTYESSLKERKQAYIKAADAVSNYTIQSNRERAAKAAADEKAATEKQTAANKAAAEKRKKDSEIIDDIFPSLNIGTNLDPFIKTPANVFMSAADYAGLTAPSALASLWSETKKADPDPVIIKRASDTLIRAGLGVILAMAIAGGLDDDVS